MFVDALDPEGRREAVVSGICKGHARCRDHTALAHREGADDSECKDGKGDTLWQDLDEIACPGLPERAVNDRRDVLNGVGNDELKKPAHDATHGGCQDDGSRARGGCVGALLRQVERRVKPLSAVSFTMAPYRCDSGSRLKETEGVYLTWSK